MDALLLEKAELQQSLVLSRKDLESSDQKAKVKHNIQHLSLKQTLEYSRWGEAML